MRFLILMAIAGGVFAAYNNSLIPGLNTPLGAFSENGDPETILYSIGAELNSKRSVSTPTKKVIQTQNNG